MHILIGAVKFAVEEHDFTREGINYLGDFNSLTQKIRLQTGMHEDQRFATLWHEVMHGALDYMGMDLGEEDVVRLGNVIVTLLKDNKCLRKSEVWSGDTAPIQNSITIPSPEELFGGVYRKLSELEGASYVEE